MSLITETAAGIYRWDGAAHKPVGATVNTQTITGTLALDQYSASVQVITPSGATRKVKLPASPGIGDSIRIINGALTGGYSIQVRDSADTTTLATCEEEDVNNEQVYLQMVQVLKKRVSHT